MIIALFFQIGTSLAQFEDQKKEIIGTIKLKNMRLITSKAKSVLCLSLGSGSSNKLSPNYKKMVMTSWVNSL